MDKLKARASTETRGQPYIRGRQDGLPGIADHHQRNTHHEFCEDFRLVSEDRSDL